MEVECNHAIEDVQVRGWDVQIYYSTDLPFLTANVTDSDISVLISFDAEFQFGWEQWPQQRIVSAARKLALQRVGDKIEAEKLARRRRWRQRQQRF